MEVTDKQTKIIYFGVIPFMAISAYLSDTLLMIYSVCTFLFAIGLTIFGG